MLKKTRLTLTGGRYQKYHSLVNFLIMSATQKVVILFRATGDVPILKQAKFKVDATEKFAKVIDFLCRQLHRETVFVYINSAFSPSPDETVSDLFENFGIDGKLVVNYASNMAWG